MSNRFERAQDQADSRRDTNSVMRLMGQMMRLPFTALFYSMEIFVRTMQGMQRMTDQGINSLAGGVAQNPNPAPGYGRGDERVTGARDNYQTTDEEDVKMWDDQDLSGDDLKYVSYSILFTKRDLEAALREEKQDLVSYATNGGSYGGLKIAKFMKDVLDGKVPRPRIWRENNYPENAKSETDWKIPEDDEKYITFVYTVDRRIEREDAEYDREKVKELRKIRSSIDGVSKKIG